MGGNKKFPPFMNLTMNYYNINNTEELISAKLEYDKINNTKQNIGEFISKLNFKDNVYVYQDNNSDIKVIPFYIDNDNIYFADNNDDIKFQKQFKEFIENKDKLNFRTLSLKDMLNESLANRYYIIKSGNIQVFD